MRNLNRLIAAGSSLQRRLCTAAAAATAMGPSPSPSSPWPPSPLSAVTKPKPKARARPRTRPNGEVWLFNRFSALEVAGGGTVSESLDQFIKMGKSITRADLELCIRNLRKFGKLQAALQMMEWMQMRGKCLSAKNQALYLDLLSNTEGISAAENYFETISKSAQNRYAYTTLLRNYFKAELADKALNLFRKMDGMKIASHALEYKNLISLFLKLDQPEVVVCLVQEMKRRNIRPNSITYLTLMHCYVCLDDIGKLERVIEEVKRDDESADHWSICSVLATAYIDVGDFEKVVSTLKLLMNVVKCPVRKADHCLISLCSGASNVSEIEGAWRNFKLACPVFNNRSYLILLQLLSNLGHKDAFKKVFREWEMKCTSYDMRLIHVAIKTYLKLDLVEEAESIFERAVKRSSGPLFKAWELFMSFFLKKRLINSALRYAEAAAVCKVRGNEWYPSPEIVTKFFAYFMEAKDVDGAEEFFKLLKRVRCDSVANNLLVETYIACGKIAPDVQGRLEEDEIAMNHEHINLPKRICFE
ncbi:Pentacotripeptide-repeat region of PRORP [Dillenia turbinata]|uniref:Pentacotripeptide-repeat region of PRORP n=1 Tax=Dillenia turbinata TaxID=194707 RepID=A0AAN8ZKD5_9MAGN